MPSSASLSEFPAPANAAPNLHDASRPTPSGGGTPSSPGVTGKYLTVVLDREAYGINVRKVREIIRLQRITPVPQLPAHIRGVINLRGRVIPVIDLRTKFSLAADCGERTCIVVVEARPAGAPVVHTGLIVNDVEEVVNLTADDIVPAPDFGTAVDTRYLLGMAKVKGRVKLLLDIDRVLASDDGLAGPSL